MRLSLITLPLLFLLSPFTSAASAPSTLPSSTDVLYWPVESPQPSLLARISYDPVSLTPTVVSYEPPDFSTEHADDQPDRLVRIGLFTTTHANSKQWVGSLTSLSSLTSNGAHKPTLRLHLSPLNEVYHVSLSPSSSSSSSPKVTSSTNPTVDLVSSEAGPRPYVNRPIVVGPDGKNSDEVVEKTFFQKYWWVFLVITFLAMSGSAEGQ